jgi:hypothetical protein
MGMLIGMAEGGWHARRSYFALFARRPDVDLLHQPPCLVVLARLALLVWRSRSFGSARFSWRMTMREGSMALQPETCAWNVAVILACL